MKKFALLSAIALSTLIVGCSSTQTRDDSSPQTAMASSDGSAKACHIKADGKKMCNKCAAKKSAMACKNSKDGQMSAKCASMKAAKACPDCKDGKMCAKCAAMKAAKACPDCKDGNMCAKCEAKKAAMKSNTKACTKCAGKKG